ncbi:hypothetical protein [Spiribacter roseus]|uniref:hypothetical protein n=1 Tax=Spiribacter roseus TaxID=1855875 RepID=UPI001F40A2B0|nr:hypothetical protein [Spiribacter roseus]KAF0282895.1 hypothetical protein BA898_05150 [Spiribacter roseus]
MALGLFVGLGGERAEAESASTGVHAYVGLSEAFRADCGDIHFGVHRVELDSAAGEISIRLSGTVEDWDSPEIKYEGADTTGISLSTSNLIDPPQLGVCEVVGAPGTGAGTISFSESTTDKTTPIAFQGVTDSNPYGFGTIAQPANPAPMVGELELNTTTLEVDGVRAATVENGLAATIGGVVAVPDRLSPGNIGGYKAVGSEDGIISVFVTFE